MAAFFKVIEALIVLPKIGDQIMKLIAEISKWLYTQKIKKLDAAMDAAIRKAMNEHDQIDLETATGSSRPGLPSGNAGTVTRDDLPGV